MSNVYASLKVLAQGLQGYQNQLQQPMSAHGLERLNYELGCRLLDFQLQHPGVAYGASVRFVYQAPNVLKLDVEPPLLAAALVLALNHPEVS